MTHIEDVQLNDYIDDDLDAGARAQLDAHVRDCADCALRLQALRALQRAVRTLPASIEPATDLRPGIRARLAASGALTGAAQAAPSRTAPPVLHVHTTAPVGRRSWRWPSLAAAALLLCALSSAITWWLVRRTAPDAIVATQPAAEGPVQLVELRATEARYQDAIGELRAALLHEPSPLEPETVRLLEQSLATIDGALADARRALAADPSNALLAEMLHANYEKKLDLLRRASAHARVRL